MVPSNAVGIRPQQTIRNQHVYILWVCMFSSRCLVSGMSWVVLLKAFSFASDVMEGH